MKGNNFGAPYTCSNIYSSKHLHIYIQFKKKLFWSKYGFNLPWVVALVDWLNWSTDNKMPLYLNFIKIKGGGMTKCLQGPQSECQVFFNDDTDVHKLFFFKERVWILEATHFPRGEKRHDVAYPLYLNCCIITIVMSKPNNTLWI